MKLRIVISSVSASLIAAIAVPIAVRAAAGPVCTVGASGADYTNIQAAVDDVNCQTVKVSAGTYVGAVTISRAVTVKGAKFNANVNGRTFAGAQESTVNGLVTINAADVTFNGFSVTNPNQGLGILVKTAGNNASVKNNIVDTVGGVAYPDTTVGIYLEYGPDNVQVAENKISHVSSIKSSQGILVGDSTSNDPSLGIRLNNNVISDITSTRGAYGIQVNNGAKTTASGYTTVKIRGNTIKNLTGAWAHAIGLEGDTPNVIVTQNTVSNLTAAGLDKIAVWFEDNSFFFTADVSRNSLDVGTSAYGIAVHPALTALYPTLNVDGTCNWWGHKSGPGSVASGSGSKVGPGVDYKPWLKSNNLNGNCGDHEDHDDDNHHWDHDFHDNN